MSEPEPKPTLPNPADAPISEPPAPEEPQKIRLEATRYGDWELNGKCVDF